MYEAAGLQKVFLKKLCLIPCLLGSLVVLTQFALRGTACHRPTLVLTQLVRGNMVAVVVPTSVAVSWNDIKYDKMAS